MSGNPERPKTYLCAPERNIATALVGVSVFGKRAMFIQPRQECCCRGGHDAMKWRRIARVPGQFGRSEREGTSWVNDANPVQEIQQSKSEAEAPKRVVKFGLWKRKKEKKRQDGKRDEGEVTSLLRGCPASCGSCADHGGSFNALKRTGVAKHPCI